MTRATIRGATKTYMCACCGEPFVARVADRKRGWARFCSKRCKAIRQMREQGPGRPVDFDGYVFVNGNDPAFDKHGVEP